MHLYRLGRPRVLPRQLARLSLAWETNASVWLLSIRGEYFSGGIFFSGMNIFQGGIFFMVEYFFGVNIARLSGLGDKCLGVATVNQG